MNDKPLINCLEETGWSVTVHALVPDRSTGSAPSFSGTAVSLSSHLYDSEWHLVYSPSIIADNGELAAVVTSEYTSFTSQNSSLSYPVDLILPDADQTTIHPVLLGTPEHKRFISSYPPDLALSPSRPDVYTSVSAHRTSFVELFADLAHRQTVNPSLVVQNSFFNGPDDGCFKGNYVIISSQTRKPNETWTGHPEFYIARHKWQTNYKIAPGELVCVHRRSPLVPWATTLVTPLTASDIQKDALTDRLKRLVGYGSLSRQ